MKSLRTILSTKKGFTLVELIVTMALLALLIAGAAGGIAAYNQYAVYKRNNEYACTVYQAAQAAVTRAKADGMLEALEEEVKKNGQVQYLMKSRGTDETLLCELLSDYISDDVLCGASICIEADFHRGIVYSVWYSDRADRFSYDGLQEMGISERKELGLGYYGEQYF